MNIIDQIHALDEEIAFGADLEAKLRRHAKRETDVDHRRHVEEQLRNFTRRLDRAEVERDELRRQARQIVRRKNEIERKVRPTVRFHSIEVTA